MFRSIRFSRRANPGISPFLLSVTSSRENKISDFKIDNEVRRFSTSLSHSTNECSRFDINVQLPTPTPPPSSLLDLWFAARTGNPLIFLTLIATWSGCTNLVWESRNPGVLRGYVSYPKASFMESRDLPVSRFLINIKLPFGVCNRFQKNAISTAGRFNRHPQGIAAGATHLASPLPVASPLDAVAEALTPDVFEFRDITSEMANN